MQDHGRRVPGVGPAHGHPPRRAGPLDAGDDEGRDRAAAQAVDRGVHLGQERGRTRAGRDTDAAQHRADLAHRGGRDEVVPDDVADHDHGGPVRLHERVVPVAAHLGRLGGRHVSHRDAQALGLGRRGEHDPLQALGDAALRVVQPCGVEREARGRGDLAARAQLLGREVAVPLTPEEREQPDGPAPAPDGQDGPGAGCERVDDVARAARPEDPVDLGRGVRLDHHRLARRERLLEERAREQRPQPQVRVLRDEVAPVRVGVPPADVAHARRGRAVVLDERHDAPLRERGDHELGEAGDRDLGVEGLGELRHDVGHELRPAGEACRALLERSALDDVGDVVDRAHHARGRGSAERPATSRDPADGPVTAHDAELRLVALVPLDRLPHGGEDPSAVVGVHPCDHVLAGDAVVVGEVEGLREARVPPQLLAGHVPVERADPCGGARQVLEQPYRLGVLPQRGARAGGVRACARTGGALAR